MFTYGLDIELLVGLLPTLLFPHSALYPPFRIHFHIFRFRILLSAFRILPMTVTENIIYSTDFSHVLSTT